MGGKLFHSPEEVPDFADDDEDVFVPAFESPCFEIISGYKPSHSDSTIPFEMWTIIFSRIMYMNRREQFRPTARDEERRMLVPNFKFAQLTTVCKLWLKLVYEGPLQESLINFQVYSDLVLVYYTSLTELNLGSNTQITDSGIRNLTNMVNLSLRYNRNITDAGVRLMTNLTTLDLESNQLITNRCVSKLTKLTTLNLSYNARVTGAALLSLQRLNDLNLNGNRVVYDEDLSCLTQLSSLSLRANTVVSEASVSLLTNLTSLNLVRNKIVDREALTTLRKLVLLQDNTEGKTKSGESNSKI